MTEADVAPSLIKQLTGSDPRTVEAAAFAEAISALERYNEVGTGEYAQACWVNHRLWTALLEALADNDNALPDQLRAQLLSIALWANRYINKMLVGEAPAEPLVMVNKSIMLGLRGIPAE